MKEETQSDVAPPEVAPPTPVGDIYLRMGFSGEKGAPDRAMILDFGQSISWVAFNRAQAVEFAEKFMERLAEL